MPPEFCLFMLVFIGGFTAWIMYVQRQFSAAQAFRNQLLVDNPLYVTSGFDCRWSITTLNGSAHRRRRAMLVVAGDGIRLYANRHDASGVITIRADNIRWFGRPVKYHDGRNKLWLHVESGGEWQLVRLSLWRGAMADIVRALKLIVAPELVTAYRRHRPYIHFGPVKAQPAEQDIHGAWSLEEPIWLYIMPLYVVLLRQDRVLRLLPLERISQIAALRRLDEPEADGLVSLTIEGERLAFAVKDYEQAATAISEAAKRSLEQPLARKQKKKDDEEDEWE